MGPKSQSVVAAANLEGPLDFVTHCPPAKELKLPGRIKKIVSEWQADFEAHDQAYRTSLYLKYAVRYELAWKMWDDKTLQSVWQAQVGSLLSSRKSDCDGDNILRTVLQFTIKDHKVASKTFRRLLQPWRDGISPQEIFQWLKDHKLQSKSAISTDRIELSSFNKAPLVLHGVASTLKANPGQSITLHGKVVRCNGADVEVGKISAFVR